MIRMLAAVAVLAAASGAQAATPKLPACEAWQMTDEREYPITPTVSRELAFPAIGEESSVEVGQTMVAAGHLDIFRYAVALDHPFQVVADRVTITVPAGVLRLNAATAGGGYYTAPMGTLKFAREPWERKHAIVGVYVPGDGAAPMAFSQDGGNLREYPYPGITVRYLECTHVGGDRLTRELIYSGVSKGTVSLTYREFLDNAARPAFTQDLTYDLASGNEIGFRGARIRIIEANNLGIRYVVLRPLTGQ